MKKEIIEKMLMSYGLSRQAALVYMYLLKRGLSSIADIARDVIIPRTTVYLIIEQLMDKALIHKGSLPRESKKYKAEHPQIFIDQLNERKKDFLNAIPHLLQVSRGDVPMVERHSNLQMIKKIYRDLQVQLTSRDYYYAFGDTESWISRDEEFFTEHAHRCTLQRDNVKRIVKNSQHAQKFKQEDMGNNSIKILKDPLLEGAIDFVIIITPKMMLFDKVKQPYEAISIKDQSLIATLRVFFELFWNQAEAH